MEREREREGLDEILEKDRSEKLMTGGDSIWHKNAFSVSQVKRVTCHRFASPRLSLGNSLPIMPLHL